MRKHQHISPFYWTILPLVLFLLLLRATPALAEAHAEAPQPYQPQGDLLTNQPQFSWWQVPKATLYQIQVYRAGKLFHNRYATLAACREHQACRVQTSLSLPQDTYTWQLRALVQDAWTEFSAPLEFHVPTLTHGMALIPEGSFWMGCDSSLNGGLDCLASDPYHQVTLSHFEIDRTEVTNTAYHDCVQAKKCRAPSYAGSWAIFSWMNEKNDLGPKKRVFYYGNPTYEDFPVLNITWQDAADYCAWAGKRLPTEAEWEKAARGTDGDLYPWGNSPPTCQLANFSPGADCLGTTAHVGSSPGGASPYGVLNMAGNAWEWVADWYGFDYYTDSPADNPSGPNDGEMRVLKGGGWATGSAFLRSSYRHFADPETYSSFIGFRCAKNWP